MRPGFALIIVALFGVICCQKDGNNDYQSSGEIIGPDLGMCICCGGWHIVVDGITYNFDSLPGIANIDLQKETFPLFVKLDWKLSTTTSCPGWITILRIKKE